MPTDYHDDDTIDIPTFADWLGVPVARAYEAAYRHGKIAGVPVNSVAGRRRLARSTCEAILAEGIACGLIVPQEDRPSVEPIVLPPEDVEALLRAYHFIEQVQAERATQRDTTPARG